MTLAINPSALVVVALIRTQRVVPCAYHNEGGSDCYLSPLGGALLLNYLPHTPDHTHTDTETVRSTVSVTVDREL